MILVDQRNLLQYQVVINYVMYPVKSLPCRAMEISKWGVPAASIPINETAPYLLSLNLSKANCDMLLIGASLRYIVC